MTGGTGMRNRALPGQARGGAEIDEFFLIPSPGGKNGEDFARNATGIESRRLARRTPCNDWQRPNTVAAKAEAAANVQCPTGSQAHRVN